jgi:uncharacterized protein (DUF433 family)
MSKTKKFDPYGGRDPRELPAYSTQEAAHYLWLPDRTLRTWVHGYSFDSGKNRRQQGAVIPVDPETGLLSFADLLELHVLAALRREHGVTLGNIRTARAYMQQRLGSAHPLIEEEMETDGTHLFLRKIGEGLINASKEGQLALEAMISARLQRIERHSDGSVKSLYPFTRKNVVEQGHAPRLVSIDPKQVFGRPVITGTRVPTAEIAERFWAGDSYDALVDEYGRSPEEVGEAIRYEWWRAAA